MSADSLSDEDYANAIRPVMLLGSYEYVRDVDLAEAKLIRSRNKANETFKTSGFRGVAAGAAAPQAISLPGQSELIESSILTRGTSGSVDTNIAILQSVTAAKHSSERLLGAAGRPVVAEVAESGSRTPKQIVYDPSDDRLMLDNGSPGLPRDNYLYRTALALVYFNPWAEASAGTAHLVGYHTALTAAHVLYDRTNGVYLDKKTAVSGLLSYENALGTIYDQSYLTGPYTCYARLLPLCWVEPGCLLSVRDVDYGALDFVDDSEGCYQEPGLWAGYMPVAIGTGVDYMRNAVWMTGYDAFDAQPVNPRYPYSSPTGASSAESVGEPVGLG